MFIDMLPRFPEKLPRLTITHFSQEIEVAFLSVNSPDVAVVSVKYWQTRTSNTQIFRFVASETEEGLVVCLDDKWFKNLPREIRKTISCAIESFRNDCMVV